MKKLVLTIFVILIASYEINTHFILPKRNDNFSERNLYHYLREVDIKYPEIVMAQAKLESGYFNSRLFKEQNNIFGMQLPKQRQTTAVGAKNGYAVYKSWKHSVMDYKLWQNGMIGKIHNHNQYFSYIFRNYAQDTNYVKHLKKIM